MKINPMFQVLDISRDLLLYGQTPEARSWLVLAAWAVGMLLVGFIVFWRGEESYGRD
jgi:teichoic acid transport system permease protein